MLFPEIFYRSPAIETVSLGLGRGRGEPRDGTSFWTVKLLPAVIVDTVTVHLPGPREPRSRELYVRLGLTHTSTVLLCACVGVQI